jgi:hypothetical protein
MRGVDQVDPEPHRLAQHLAGFTRVGLAPHARETHGSEPEPVDAQLAADREGAERVHAQGCLPWAIELVVGDASLREEGAREARALVDPPRRC